MDYQKQMKQYQKKNKKKRLAKDFIDKFPNSSNIPNSSKHFSAGLFQNYLEFIPAKKYIQYFSVSTWIDS